MLLARFPNVALDCSGNFPPHWFLADRICRSNFAPVKAVPRICLRNGDAVAPS